MSDRSRAAAVQGLARKVASRTPEPVVRVEGLSKSYGSVQALCGIDLEVAAGEILGVLGPIGAVAFARRTFRLDMRTH
jgi:ABC-type glutathione transport system ATPase component